MAVSTVVKQLWKTLTNSGFEQNMNKVILTKAAAGVCIAEMTVEKEHTNIKGGLHGGLTCTLVDSISGMALVSQTGDEYTGVSVDLHVTFMKGVSLGENIIIEAKTIKRGKNLAFLEVNITNKDTGAIIAKGLHTKFIKHPKK